MSTVTSTRATIDELLDVEEKAELIGGRIVRFMPSGFLPGLIALEITLSLKQWVRTLGVGVVLGDNIGFSVPELDSGRETFCPDASYYVGALPKNTMRFIEGAPTLAVKVRSAGDYGPAAQRAIDAKRADYFAAGTEVVWDVDPIDELIRVYRRTQRDEPTTYRRGQTAEAEPAVPGWQPLVDDLFPPADPLPEA